MNECSLPNACGPGSLCTNFPGGHHCECPEGYTGDAYGAGCYDVDECSRAPCGKDALCHNNEGSFRCSCPPGFVGDPFHSCKGMRRTHKARLRIIIIVLNITTILYTVYDAILCNNQADINKSFKPSHLSTNQNFNELTIGNYAQTTRKSSFGQKYTAR